jgi:hypothetical protein
MFAGGAGDDEVPRAMLVDYAGPLREGATGDVASSFLLGRGSTACECSFTNASRRRHAEKKARGARYSGGFF